MSNLTPLADANAMARFRLINQPFSKRLITHFDYPRIVMTALVRLRTNHHNNNKFLPDKTKTYIHSKICPKSQLTLRHAFECPNFLANILRLDMLPLLDPLREILYNHEVSELAAAVFRTFDNISDFVILFLLTMSMDKTTTGFMPSHKVKKTVIFITFCL